MEKTTVGIFNKELKNRFVCEVLVENEVVECYISSSCRLDNFIDLHGKQVLLLPKGSTSARTKYSLFAAPYKRNHILLNIGMVNSVIGRNISRKYFSSLGKRSEVYREHMVNSYKSDFYITNTRTLIEVKTVLSLGKEATFPSVFSQRTIDQLNKLSSLMDSGYNAALVIVSLSPYVELIQIDHHSPFYDAVLPCVDKGMKLLGISINIHNGEARIKKSIKIKL